MRKLFEGRLVVFWDMLLTEKKFFGTPLPDELFYIPCDMDNIKVGFSWNTIHSNVNEPNNQLIK